MSGGLLDRSAMKPAFVLPRLTSIRSAKQVGNRGPGARSQEFRSSGVRELLEFGGRTIGDRLEGESFGSGAGKYILAPGSWRRNRRSLVFVANPASRESETPKRNRTLNRWYFPLSRQGHLSPSEKRLPSRPISSRLSAMSYSLLGFQRIIRLKKCQIAVASTGR
jgi:hypothetical protein